ncbi:MAG: hypothetical protein WED10_06890 [Brumimicrobium sp.]
MNFALKNSWYVFFILLLFSCSVQDIEKYNEDFKGSWKSDKYYSASAGDTIRNYLKIDGKDSGFGLACKKDSEFTDCLYFQSGKAKYNKASKGLQIGNSVQQIYRIDEEPHVNNNGEWQIMIDSIPYYRY